MQETRQDMEQGPDPMVGTFEAFFARHHRDLFGALWLITRNRHEAEEVMQDAFLKVLERWDRVAPMDDPVAYLYRTAMNVHRSRYRRAKVAVRRAVGRLPTDELAAVEEREDVIRLLAGLTPRERAAVVLIDLLEFSSQEAGDALGVKASTVRVLVSRGRKSLKKEMQTP